MSHEREVTLHDAIAYARAEMKRRRYERAERVLRQIVEARPGHLSAIADWARSLQHLNRFDDAVAVLRKAVALGPSVSRLRFNMANALRNCGETDAAITSFRRAVRLEPANTEMHVGLALALMQAGMWEEGFVEYEWRRARREFVEWMKRADRPVWNGGPVAGRTVLLIGEQGAGDSIHFVRYATLLAERGATVMVNCQPSLRRLLTSVPGVSKVVQGRLDAFDTAEVLMSLPMRFGTRPDTIPAGVPYLSATTPPPVRLPDNGVPRAGLVWAGNAAHVRDHWRSLPFGALGPLLDVGGIDFFSLQKGASAEHPRLTDLGSHLRDFADTAAVVEQLDVVITVDTSVAHLAGAMGKPVWILLARNTDWRWLEDGDSTPWYPTARLFRQRELGQWDTVVAAVADALAGFR
ncbi:MAG TPA: tetratricopeptide repeat-containing glycosyltransferase family protein [Azospirillum sp.]|nr:tetratricopeptide repeat-containing glycosyltransferase family protein [Azospirillum sp.]